jgi:hypothetical protein
MYARFCNILLVSSSFCARSNQALWCVSLTTNTPTHQGDDQYRHSAVERGEGQYQQSLSPS